MRLQKEGIVEYLPTFKEIIKVVVKAIEKLGPKAKARGKYNSYSLLMKGIQIALYS